jgi:hypothetical protein
MQDSRYRRRPSRDPMIENKLLRGRHQHHSSDRASRIEQNLPSPTKERKRIKQKLPSLFPPV